METENIETTPQVEETKRRSAPAIRITRDELQKLKRILSRLPKKKEDDGMVLKKDALQELKQIMISLHIKKNYDFKEIKEHIEANSILKTTSNAIKEIIDQATAPAKDGQYDVNEEAQATSHEEELQTDSYI